MLRYASARRRNRSCRPESQCSREARAGYGQMKTSGNRSFMWFRDRVNQWKFAWKSCFRLPLLYSRGSRGCAVAEGLRFSCIAHPAASAASRISASTSRPGRAVRPGRALFSESARAATRGARGIGNSNTSRVARPGRALFLERPAVSARGYRASFPARETGTISPDPCSQLHPRFDRPPARPFTGASRSCRQLPSRRP